MNKASDHTFVRNAQARLQPTFWSSWQELALDVELTEDYPVEVEVGTQNNDGQTAVYFDDLVVEYTPGPVVEENQYYAYGERLEGLSWRRSDARSYGRGYQGQHTTQDAETGYTAFDLRLYDTRYGRWLMNDPKRQHASGYLGMGNNPVSNVDLDGGKDEWYPSVDGSGNAILVKEAGDSYKTLVDNYGTEFASSYDAKTVNDLKVGGSMRMTGYTANVFIDWKSDSRQGWIDKIFNNYNCFGLATQYSSGHMSAKNLSFMDTPEFEEEIGRDGSFNENTSVHFTPGKSIVVLRGYPNRV